MERILSYILESRRNLRESYFVIRMCLCWSYKSSTNSTSWVKIELKNIYVLWSELIALHYPYYHLSSSNLEAWHWASNMFFMYAMYVCSDHTEYLSDFLPSLKFLVAKGEPSDFELWGALPIIIHCCASFASYFWKGFMTSWQWYIPQNSASYFIKIFIQPSKKHRHNHSLASCETKQYLLTIG